MSCGITKYELHQIFLHAQNSTLNCEILAHYSVFFGEMIHADIILLYSNKYIMVSGLRLTLCLWSLYTSLPG